MREGGALVPQLIPLVRAVGAAAGERQRQLPGLGQHEGEHLLGTRAGINRGTVGDQQTAAGGGGPKLRRVKPRETGAGQVQPAQPPRLEHHVRAGLPKRNVRPRKRRIGSGRGQHGHGRPGRPQQFVRRHPVGQHRPGGTAPGQVGKNLQGVHAIARPRHRGPTPP